MSKIVQNIFRVHNFFEGEKNKVQLIYLKYGAGWWTAFLETYSIRSNRLQQKWLFWRTIWGEVWFLVCFVFLVVILVQELWICFIVYVATPNSYDKFDIFASILQRVMHGGYQLVLTDHCAFWRMLEVVTKYFPFFCCLVSKYSFWLPLNYLTFICS